MGRHLFDAQEYRYVPTRPESLRAYLPRTGTAYSTSVDPMNQDQAEKMTFELRDAPRRLHGVRLVEEIGLAGPLEFARTGPTWRLDVPRPDVDRMEYLFEIDDRRGRRSTITDAANPRRVDGAFGAKSVLEFPEYRPPVWLEVEPVTAESETSEVDAPSLHDAVGVTVWAPAGLPNDQPAPLLLVHDGPEYARLADFTHFVGAAVALGDLPPVRVALLDPGDRNVWYSANPDYAHALCEAVVPSLEDKLAVTTRIGVGASLGGLALLHAHRSCPGTFDALLLQSGSFFTPEHDPQESEFPAFPQITAFVRTVAETRGDPAPIPAVLTCGTVEENLANNTAMAAILRRLGYPCRLVTVRDAHNYTAWRDALHPHLTQLVTRLADDAHAA
jgi:enterochelin esterase-like enzyme